MVKQWLPIASLNFSRESSNCGRKEWEEPKWKKKKISGKEEEVGGKKKEEEDRTIHGGYQALVQHKAAGRFYASLSLSRQQCVRNILAKERGGVKLLGYTYRINLCFEIPLAAAYLWSISNDRVTPIGKFSVDEEKKIIRPLFVYNWVQPSQGQ